MLDSNVEFTGIKSKISDGIARLLLTKLQLHKRAFTVEPIGVRDEVELVDAVVMLGYVPVLNPKSDPIDPVVGKVIDGVALTAGSPEPHPTYVGGSGDGRGGRDHPDVKGVGTCVKTIIFV